METQIKTNAANRYPLTVYCAVNGDLIISKLSHADWKRITPDGVPFQVLQNNDLFISFHCTRLSDAEAWWVYLTGDCWHHPLQATGPVNFDTDPPKYAGLNEAIETMLKQVDYD